MNATAGELDAGARPAVGRARRLTSWFGRRVVRSATYVAGFVTSVRDAVRPPPAVVDQDGPDGTGAPTATPDVRPQWIVVAAAMVFAGCFLALRLSPTTALYWYAFPLFGLGIPYVIQFRAELSARWWTVLGGSTVLSVVALAQDWAFSGHILWNVLFLGHAAQAPARRTWVIVLLASLVHLFAMKIAFQRPKDVVGGFVAVAVALAALPLAGPRRGRRPAPPVPVPSV